MKIEDTSSFCSHCSEIVPAHIVIEEGHVYIRKMCKLHGEHRELLEEDADYYMKRLDFDKPGTECVKQTAEEKGCPFDCGLCPSHKQHTCIGLVEVTNRCDQGCPVCYADAGEGEMLSLGKYEEMLDFFAESEGGKAEILQISGGEPTLHPDILEMIRIARTKNIGYVMLNTNGKRLSEDPGFVAELAKHKKLEVYLQYDGSAAANMHLRGRDLTGIKKKAIENCRKHRIPVTLVTTVDETNLDELGGIIRYGLETKGIRGINIQPMAYFGRYKEGNRRVTRTGIIKSITSRLPDIFEAGDIVPLPCNVERISVSYLVKFTDRFMPVTRKIRLKNYVPLISNTLLFDADEMICGCNCLSESIRKVMTPYRLLPDILKKNFLDERTFRITITSFVDKLNFDTRSMQKECVHVITKDLRKIPFSAYNMVHREHDN